MKTQNIVAMIANIISTLQNLEMTPSEPACLSAGHGQLYAVRLHRISFINNRLTICGYDEHLFSVRGVGIDETVGALFCRSLRCVSIEQNAFLPGKTSLMFSWRDRANDLFHQEFILRHSRLDKLELKFGGSWYEGDGKNPPGGTIWYVHSVGDLVRVTG